MTTQDAVPLNHIPAGTAMFVTGSNRAHVDTVALSLVLEAGKSDDGLFLVATDTDTDRLLERCVQVDPDVDAPSTAVVDCTGRPAGDDTSWAVNRESLPDAGALTALGIKFSVVYEHLVIEGYTPVLVAVLSVTDILEATDDLRDAIRFLQIVTGRVRGTGSFSLFTLDRTAHDEETISTVKQVCDGGIEVQSDDDDIELRVDGLPDQPEGWTPFSVSVLPDLRSD